MSELKGPLTVGKIRKVIADLADDVIVQMFITSGPDDMGVRLDHFGPVDTRRFGRSMPLAMGLAIIDLEDDEDYDYDDEDEDEDEDDD